MFAYSANDEIKIILGCCIAQLVSDRKAAGSSLYRALTLITKQALSEVEV